jgi:hypothetical protein
MSELRFGRCAVLSIEELPDDDPLIEELERSAEDGEKDED